MVVLWLLLGLIALYAAAIVGIAYFSLHPPRTPLFFAPGLVGCPQEEVEVETSDGEKIRGWFVEAPNTELVVVMAHGYLMNRSELAPISTVLFQHGISSLPFDFRAHGKSSGAKTSLGINEKEDLRAIVAWVRERSPRAAVVIMGSSMGAACAAMCAGEGQGFAEGLILDSAYSNLGESVEQWWEFLGGKKLAAFLWPVSRVCGFLLGHDPYLIDISLSLADAGDLPVLFLHGEEDKVAPIRAAEANHEAARMGRLEKFAGCDHSEGRFKEPERYHEIVLDFLGSVMTARKLKVARLP